MEENQELQAQEKIINVDIEREMKKSFQMCIRDRSITGDKPVMFLDDVMSELDENRQDYILNHLKDQQVFITCCDPNTIHQLKQGALFKIHQGELIEQKILKS